MILRCVIGVSGPEVGGVALFHTTVVEGHCEQYERNEPLTLALNQSD